MTIGPEPITSTEWMSSRSGMSVAPHHVAETVEQDRPHHAVRPRLGVVLHHEGPPGPGTVLRRRRRSDRRATPRRVPGVSNGSTVGAATANPVVVGGHLDPARRQILDRLVDPRCPEPQLVGVQAQRPAQHLVAETDAEQWPVGLEDPAHHVDGVDRRSPGPRSVGQEETVPAPVASRSDRLVLAGMTITRMPVRRPRWSGLDPEIHRGDRNTRFPVGFEPYAARRSPGVRSAPAIPVRRTVGQQIGGSSAAQRRPRRASPPVAQVPGQPGCRRRRSPRPRRASARSSSNPEVARQLLARTAGSRTT